MLAPRIGSGCGQPRGGEPFNRIDSVETGGTPGPGAASVRPGALHRAPAEPRMGGAEGAPKWQ